MKRYGWLGSAGLRSRFSAQWMTSPATRTASVYSSDLMGGATPGYRVNTANRVSLSACLIAGGISWPACSRRVNSWVDIVHIRKLDSALPQHRFNGLFHSLLGVEAQVLQVDALSLRLRQQHITPCSVQ